MNNLNKTTLSTAISENLTVSHATMLHNLFTARAASLEVFIKAGINDVQSGQNANSKKAIVLPNQIAYAIVEAEENTAFLTLRPDASTVQVKKNLAQKVSTLKLWLSTGKFATNTGRDKPRVEHELALELSNTAQIQAFQAIRNTKASDKIAAESKINAKKQQDGVIAAQKIAAAAKNTKDKKDAEDKLERQKLASKQAASDLIANEKEALRLKTLSDIAVRIRDKAIADEATKKQAAIDAKKPKAKTDVKKPELNKVQTEENKISPKAGCSDEMRLIAAEVFAELKLDGVPNMALLELARLINAELLASK
ncbi:MAG: hypothetical protein LUQ26_09920 [Methylococcaceae bacterium]|nr:hypothetical protein [Methylococcaceae bacterium]